MIVVVVLFFGVQFPWEALSQMRKWIGVVDVVELFPKCDPEFFFLEEFQSMDFCFCPFGLCFQGFISPYNTHASLNAGNV